MRNDIVWNTAGTSVYLACTWLITVLVVTLSPDYEASGSLAVAMAVGNIFIAIMLFKTRTVQVADIENVYTTSDIMAHRVLTFLIASAFCLVYSAFTVAPSDFMPVLAYLAFKSVESLIDVLHGLDQKNGHFDYIGVSLILRGILAVLAFSAGLIIFHDLTIALFLMTASSIFVGLFYDVPRSRKLDSLLPRFSTPRIKTLFTASIAGFFASLLCTTLVSIVRQSYGLIYGNEALGIYAALSAPAVIMQAIAGFIYTPLIGPMSLLWKERRSKDLIQLVTKFLLLLVGLTLACMAVFFLIGDPLLSFIFQKGISSYAYLMYPLLACTATTAVVYFLIDLLIVQKERIGTLAANTASLLTALFIMHPLFEALGANGISITIIVAFALNTLIALTFFAKNVKNAKTEDPPIENPVPDEGRHELR